MMKYEWSSCLIILLRLAHQTRYASLPPSVPCKHFQKLWRQLCNVEAEGVVLCFMCKCDWTVEWHDANLVTCRNSQSKNNLSKGAAKRLHGVAHFIWRWQNSEGKDLETEEVKSLWLLPLPSYPMATLRCIIWKRAEVNCRPEYFSFSIAGQLRHSRWKSGMLPWVSLHFSKQYFS